MKDCIATEIMMDKARIVTLIQKLCGERIQIKKSMFCFQLFELLSFESTVLLAFAVLTFFFVWTVKTTLITECFPMQFG